MTVPTNPWKDFPGVGALIDYLLSGSAMRDAVATQADLPVGDKNGETRLVLSDYSLWAWNESGQVWQAVTGGAGGGTPTTPQNLFVQPTRPDVSVLLRDSLWIPTNPDGTAADVSLWEVYTGTGSGNGANLYVQVTAPTPAVDALWVPLNSNGTPMYIDRWQVFTGRGSAFGVGNSNLVISQVLPATPTTGTLFIPLNADETAKTIDFWEVYA